MIQYSISGYLIDKTGSAPPCKTDNIRYIPKKSQIYTVIETESDISSKLASF